MLPELVPRSQMEIGNGAPGDTGKQPLVFSSIPQIGYWLLHRDCGADWI